MKYEQIIALLERGLTPEQIVTLGQAPDAIVPQDEPEQPQQPQPAPVKDNNEQPAWAAALQQSIDRMTNARHANAIMRQQMPEQHVMTPEEALAEVIAPPKK